MEMVLFPFVLFPVFVCFIGDAYVNHAPRYDYDDYYYYCCCFDYYDLLMYAIIPFMNESPFVPSILTNKPLIACCCRVQK